METNDKVLLKPSSICLGIVLAAASIGAHAQSTVDETGGQIEEIIVTAEIRAADVQDTPIAITAITGEMLEIGPRRTCSRWPTRRRTSL